MSNLRLVLRPLTLALALVVALPLHAAWRIVRAPSPWPRRFLLVCAYIVGARPRVSGVPLRRDAVLLANHLSWIDILLLAGTTGCTFVAKAELRDVPLVGWLCGLNDTIFVARGDRMAVGAQVDALRGALAQGRPVAIFPEGTTGDGLELLPFKPALLAALDPPPPGLRVQPVRIAYVDRALAWVGDEAGGAHAARVLRRRGSFAAELNFGAPFVPEGGRKAIAAEARARIAALAPSP